MKFIKSLFFLLCSLAPHTFMQGAAAPNKNFQYVIDANGRVWRSNDPRRRFHRTAPDDMVIPHGNHGKTVTWSEKNYADITPKTQQEYVDKKFKQYQQETLYASYDDLCDLVSVNNARQEEIDAEYHRKTGAHRVSHIQEFFSSAAHQNAMQEIQAKSAEERINFYNSQSDLRALEAEYALLTLKIDHTKTQANALKKLLHKDIDDYANKHAAIDPSTLKSKHLPTKEKEIDDLQGRVDNLELSLAKRKKSLEETIQYLAAFTGSLLDKAWANVSGFLNSDGDFNVLTQRKNALEHEILITEQSLQRCKNLLYIYTHQREYLLSRTEHYDDLVEIFSTDSKADAELQSVIGKTIARDAMDYSVASHTLSQPQKDLILQSNADKALFEFVQGDSTQNYMFRKINETMAIAAERQAKSPADKKLTAYNHATAVLCALSHEHNEQGSAIASLASHKLAQACNLASMYDTAEKGSKETLETIKNYVDSAIHYIKDRDYVDDLDQAWASFKKNISNPNTQKEVGSALALTASVSRRIPIRGRGMRNPGGAVAITRALGEVVAREAAIAGVVIAAGGAISHHAPLLHSIDNGLKPGGSNGKKDVEWVSHGHRHISKKNISWKKIIEGTKGNKNPAKYKPDMKITDVENLERDVWKRGIPTKKLQTWKVMKYDKIIGASEGVETECVVVKMSANTIHGHPITLKEYKRLLDLK